MSPEISVIQPNQVQMVFSSSDIILSKVFVVIYRNKFWTKLQTPASQIAYSMLFCFVCVMACLC